MLGAGTFAEATVVDASALIKVPDDLDLTVAALLGCAVLTGVGAAVNTAAIRPGDTVAVVGCGGVGLNIVQGAKMAGAGQIVAVDVHAGPLELASRLGATHTVDASCPATRSARCSTSPPSGVPTSPSRPSGRSRRSSRR